MDDPRLPLQHVANAGILAWFSTLEHAAERVAAEPRLASCAPEDVPEPHRWLGTHPDVLVQLRGTLGDSLPERCNWVVRGMPVLAHPRTGVIFAFAGGMDYALRLPPPVLHDALRLGVKQVKHSRGTPSIGIAPWTLDLARIGPEWCFGSYRADEVQWCRAAFEAAR
jgi:hypothetical protein